MKYILAHMKEKKRLTKCERVCAVRRKITIPKKILSGVWGIYRNVQKKMVYMEN